MDTLIDLSAPNLRRGITRPAIDGDGNGDGDGETARPAPLLVLRFDDGRELPVDRTLQIGASPSNHVVLDDPLVSGVHCVLVRYAGRTFVKDLGSRNGCWLGATRVRLAELAAGARLTVGGTTIEVAAVGAEDAAMLGASAALGRVRRELQRAAPTRLPILLLGESGTGKELAARALHEGSRRRGPLVAVNCGALAPEVVESELFGHERGAFTGAAGRRLGLFAEADGGTLFFDEIGELPLLLQPKLLRALETGTVRAVGGTGERKVDVRVVAATHRNLKEAMEEHSFRLDLYHRMSAIEIRLPPLRERRDDIALLARHFLEETGVGGPVRSFSPAALEAMERHSWPGNVRELRNVVVRAAHFGRQVIEAEDLFPLTGQPPPIGIPAPAVRPAESLRLDEMQRHAVERALRLHGGRVRAAARALGIPPSTLHDRVRRLRLG